MDANGATGADTIDFAVAGKIQLTTGALPAITDTMTLDGTSAPGFVTAPVVQVDASGFGGLTFDTGSVNSVLESLSIVKASGAAVTLNDNGIVVMGNYLGLNLNGSTSGANSGDGLAINSTSSGNTIGGTSALERNVISGNGGNGISVAGSTGNQIAGNFIGTDATGAVALGNKGNGIQLANSAGNKIGSGNPLIDNTYYNADLVSLNSQPVSLWQGIRGGDAVDHYLISGTSGDNGLLFEGTIAGVGTSFAVNYPGASTTSVYGPDNQGAGKLGLVGTYKNADFQTAPVTVNGFLFQGTTADLSTSANYHTVDYPGAKYNYVHSVMGGFAVGNYDSAADHGQGGLPLGPGHAFLYSVASGTFLTDIVYPGSKSNTAYGIWYNGGTSYTICGGWSPDIVNNLQDQDHAIGHGDLVDYDSATGQFSHWTSFDYPFGTNYFTHFEGISSVEPGVYTLNADSGQSGTANPFQGSWVTVSRNADGSFGTARWLNLDFPGTLKLTSSNSVYGNQVVGIVFFASGVLPYQATINVEPSNVISGNGASGVLLTQGSHDNIMEGNLIGLDVTGFVSLGNKGDGVQLTNSNNNLVGHSDPVTGISYHTADKVSPTPLGWTGIRNSDTTGNFLISGISGTQGLLFDGTIAGVGITKTVNVPLSATTTASATAVYGPDNLAGNTVRLVGSYNTTGTGLADQKGFVFEGTVADLSNPARYTTIDAGGQFNIVHSTMGGLAVGNSDSSPSQGQASLLAHAFLYDIGQKKFLPDIVYPGSVSNTAYGIWYNGGTSYTICGGWSNDAVNNFPDPNQPIGQGYLVDYDSVTQAFTHWTTFQYPFGLNFFTHFEGISSVEPGVYTLNADSAQAGSANLIQGQGSFVTVRRNTDGSFGAGQWLNLDYPGTTNFTSSDSVYGNQVVGVVFSGATPFAYQATVNIGFQLSNVISGNGGNGIELSGANNNQIAMNYIGTDLTGALDRGNSGNGILLTAAAASNLIGGEAAGNNNPTGDKGTIPAVFVRPPQGNLISGNDANGVLMNGLATKNELAGNFIGTTALGNTALGNTLDGVAIDQAHGNQILGCTFQQNPFVFYNVLSSNGGNGVRVTNSNDTTIQADFLGLGADNASPLGNKLDGLLINGSSVNTQFGGVIPLGNVVAANGRNGVEIADTASGTVVFNPFIGLPAFQDTPVGDVLDGILITSTGGNNLIRMSISSNNGGNGVHISGNATGVTVVNVVAGLNTAGTKPEPNGANGVLIDGNAHDNTIGGFLHDVAPQNTFSYNGANGLAIVGNAYNNAVFNTFLGTDNAAVVADGNSGAGLFIGGSAHDNSIGGNQPGYRNIISGNLGGGVQLTGHSHDNQFAGNLIGTDRTGQLPLPNHGNGITIVGSSNGIGGNLAGAGNTIAFNTQAGIVVDSGTGNDIRANSIFSNASSGILLVAGGNQNQPAPTLTGAYQPTPSTLQVSGTLTAAANTTYSIEIFATPSGTPAGQGKTLVGALQVVTNASGIAPFVLTASFAASAGTTFTATATSPTNNTSAFSTALALGGSANSIYVASAYGLLLGRVPDSTAVFWVNLLNNGASSANVVLGIEASVEYVTDQVDALYIHYLKRPADPAGLQFWVSSVQMGGTFEQVAEGLVSSPEYFQDHGSTNQGYVLGLYKDVFDRVPTATELDGWVNLLNGGESRLAVAISFLTSMEYRTELIEADYATFLGRPADAIGLDAFLKAMQAGATDQEVLATIFGSPEGFTRWS